LGDAIERYVAWLSDQGYAARSIYRRVPLLMHFGEYAAKHGAERWDDLPPHIETFVDDWIDRDGHRHRGNRQRLAKELRNPIRQMLRLLLSGDWEQEHACCPTPFADRAPGFFDYLRHERGLQPASITLYACHLRRLERYLEHIGGVGLGALSPAMLNDFLTDSGQALSPPALRALCAQIRVFLRYLYREGLVSADLSVHVDSPRVYRLADIPRAISWDEVAQLLAAVDRRSQVGKRDYAILVLLVTYGLRAREVAALTLDALDWVHERVAIPSRKSDHSSSYPLSAAVGEAIVDYLQHARAQSRERAIFLRACAPYTPMSYQAVAQCVGRRLKRAGIAVARPGSHTLRHTCVQRLVEADFSLETIGDYVGHSQPKSTEIYTKIDLQALRDLALGEGEALL
jgi:integrase/recombinase XerD